jgi:monovalent cation:H+ antiporter-2, CPA2 family
MSHETPLIATIVAGLGLAFLFGLLAQRLRLPTLAGYLMAGVIIGPFTPGYVADQELANELAELGVILLMFGVGLHFSIKDLMAVKNIAIPGALGQIAVAGLAGLGLSAALGWSIGAGLIFGLSLSVASTVVLLRALEERGLVAARRGQIAVGWLIVEDLVMVVTLVLIPPLAGLLGGATPPLEGETVTATALGMGPVAAALATTAVKVAAFVALMLVVGRKLIPAALDYVARTGSAELFRLSVLAIALGVAFGSAYLFGVSFALGAFFAGMVMAGSPLSHQAAEETLPLRDAFAVLFFVSVGMLFNPMVLLQEPLAVLATVLVIVLVKSAAAYGIVRAFGHGKETALTIAASLAQIGEFSFILIVLGVTLDIVPIAARDLVVAGALLSILINPVLFHLLDRWSEKHPAPDGVSKADIEAALADEPADADAETPPAPPSDVTPEAPAQDADKSAA